MENDPFSGHFPAFSGKITDYLIFHRVFVGILDPQSGSKMAIFGQAIWRKWGHFRQNGRKWPIFGHFDENAENGSKKWPKLTLDTGFIQRSIWDG